MTPTSTTSHPAARVAPTARDYFRVSKDDSGRLRSATEQKGDNRTRWAGELSFNGESYAEADAISASRFAAKSRGGFDRLMTDLRTNRFGAEVLVLWEPSRGSRKVGEWCSLIDLCHEAGVRIAVTTHGRIYDPGNTRDRRTLQEDAVDAEYESGKISDRVLRAMTANATNGKPHARVPFGYRRRYDERTRQLIAQEPEPDEAAVIVELFDRLQRGHSLKAIARDFDARGIRGRPSPHLDDCPPSCERHHPEGVVLSAQRLRDLALKPTYGGYRSHYGKLTKASWDALVPATTFHAVQRMFAERKGSSPRSGRARHLLSGIVVCDVCGGPLAAEPRHGKTAYRCRFRRCVTVDKAALDDYAEKVIVAYLSRRGHAEALTADDGADEALDAARGDVAKIKAELDRLYDEVEAGEVTRRMAAADEARLTKALDAAEARVTELSTPSRLRGLIDPGADVAKWWAAAPLSAKREAARMVLTPELVGELRVARTATRQSTPVETRVKWRTA